MTQRVAEVPIHEVLATFNVARAHLAATKLEGKEDAIASIVEPLRAVRRLVEAALGGDDAELAGFRTFPWETTPRLDAARARYQATVFDLRAETRGLPGTLGGVERVVAGVPK